MAQGERSTSLDEAVKKLKHTPPHDGTSLINAFNAAKTLDPLPDQILLVTDGLPTQGATAPAIRKAVEVEQRSKLFDQSLSALPPRVPMSASCCRWKAICRRRPASGAWRATRAESS